MRILLKHIGWSKKVLAIPGSRRAFAVRKPEYSGNDDFYKVKRHSPSESLRKQFEKILFIQDRRYCIAELDWFLYGIGKDKTIVRHEKESFARVVYDNPQIPTLLSRGVLFNLMRIADFDLIKTISRLLYIRYDLSLCEKSVSIALTECLQSSHDGEKSLKIIQWVHGNGARFGRSPISLNIFLCTAAINNMNFAQLQALQIMIESHNRNNFTQIKANTATLNALVWCITRSTNGDEALKIIQWIASGAVRMGSSDPILLNAGYCTFAMKHMNIDQLRVLRDIMDSHGILRDSTMDSALAEQDRISEEDIQKVTDFNLTDSLLAVEAVREALSEVTVVNDCVTVVPILTSSVSDITVNIYYQKSFGRPVETADITVIVPLRLPSGATNLDYSPQELIEMWADSVPIGKTVHILLGINCRSSDEKKLHEDYDELNSDILKISQKYPNVSGLSVFFTWESEEVPFGTFRNILLNELQKSQFKVSRLVSMDADTKVNRDLVQNLYTFSAHNERVPFAYRTYGYRLKFDSNDRWASLANRLDIDIRRNVTYFNTSNNRYIPVTYFSEAMQVFVGERVQDVMIQGCRYADYGMDGHGLRHSLEARKDGALYPHPLPSQDELPFENLPEVKNVTRFQPTDSSQCSTLYLLPESHANIQIMAARIASCLSMMQSDVLKVMVLFSPWKLLQSGMSFGNLITYINKVQGLSISLKNLTEEDKEKIKFSFKLKVYFNISEGSNIHCVTDYLKKILDIGSVMGLKNKKGILPMLRMIEKWSDTIVKFLIDLSDSDRNSLLLELCSDSSEDGRANWDVLFPDEIKTKKTWSGRDAVGVKPFTQDRREERRADVVLSPIPLGVDEQETDIVIPESSVSLERMICVESVQEDYPDLNPHVSSEDFEKMNVLLRNKRAKALFSLIIPKTLGISGLVSEAELRKIVTFKMLSFGLEITVQGLSDLNLNLASYS